MEKEINDLKAVFDAVLFQVSEQTIKLNVLTGMVLGVYRETLPEETFEHIAKNFFDSLEENLSEMLNELEKGNAFFDNSSLFRKKIDLLLSVKETRASWNLKS